MFDRFRRLCLAAHIRFALKATVVLRCRDLTRWARTRHRLTGWCACAARGHAGATPLSSVMNSHPSSRIRISCYRLAAGRSPTGIMMCAYGVPFHMT
jgi:hypothetical protein